MKFKVSQLSIKNGTAATGKPWTMFNFTNMYDAQKYSCFSQAGYTDSFAEGYEFEAEYTEKPNPKGGTYKNVQWPKAQRGAPQNYQPSNPQLIEAIKLQLERMEKKLDALVDGNRKYDTLPEDLPFPKGLPTDIPPMPTDDDNYSSHGDVPF